MGNWMPAYFYRHIPHVALLVRAKKRLRLQYLNNLPAFRYACSCCLLTVSAAPVCTCHSTLGNITDSYVHGAHMCASACVCACVCVGVGVGVGVGVCVGGWVWVCADHKGRRRPGGTSLRWIDVISRDLVGVTNWQEVVKDRAKWRAVVCQPKPVTV